MNVRTLGRPAGPRVEVVIAALLSLLTTAVLAFPALAFFLEETPTATQPLRGVFTVTITQDDIPSNLAGGPALAGLWNITFNGDGCAEWTAPAYRFLLLAVNMTPGYEACIAEPPLLYRSARFVINVMILGTFIANLPDLIGKAGR